ncbi:MAG: metallophosphoesterase [Actinomycetota bacterium]
MAERIERRPVDDLVRFVVAGDSGAWPDPTADGIFAQLLSQIAEFDPVPAFFANLGDFAGPGTKERHDHYLRLVETLPIPDICVIGNHDLDDDLGWDTFERVHGPVNFDFACGHTRFIVIHAEPGAIGAVEVTGVGTAEGTQGPRDEDLAFLERSLQAADEPQRIVLMHMPPYLEGRYAPHDDWGFRRLEPEFLGLLRTHNVSLVCCAHGLAFDENVHDGIRFVMSGGGGSGLCSHLRGVCIEGFGHPEERGSLYHAVEITISAAGAISGRVIQAFDRGEATPRHFGAVPARR